MASVTLNELKEGMIISSPVYNDRGNLLLNKGVEITPKIIKILKSWGIPKINILSAEDEKKKTADPEKVKIKVTEYEDYLNAAFGDKKLDTISKEIKLMAIELYKQHLLDGDIPL